MLPFKLQKIKFKLEVICNTLNKHKIKRYHFRERKSRWHWDSACAKKVSLVTRVSEFFQSPLKFIAPLDDDGLFRDVQLISVRLIRMHSKNQVRPRRGLGKKKNDRMRIEPIDKRISLRVYLLISKFGHRQLLAATGTTSWIFLLFDAIGLRPSLFLYTWLMTML